MFHMSREIYDKVEELARLLAESEEVKAMKQAEAEGKKDLHLAMLLTEYTQKQRILEAEIDKEDRDFDLISALTLDTDEIRERLRAIPAYQTILQKRGEYESLMQGVNDALRNIINPDIQCSCSGRCDTCGGCDQN